MVIEDNIVAMFKRKQILPDFFFFNVTRLGYAGDAMAMVNSILVKLETYLETFDLWATVWFSFIS